MSADKLKKLKRLRTLGKILDNAIPIPGTKYKIGLDPIIGLFPAVGDYLTLIVSGYIVYESAKLGAKQDTLTKMALNILIDSLIGTVPVAGDLFDVAWKANLQNLELLEKDLPILDTNATRESREDIDWKPLILIFAAIALVLTISSIFIIWVLKLVFTAISS